MAIDSVGSAGGFDYAGFFSSSLAADTEDFELAEVGSEIEAQEPTRPVTSVPDSTEILIGAGLNFTA